MDLKLMRFHDEKFAINRVVLEIPYCFGTWQRDDLFWKEIYTYWINQCISTRTSCNTQAPLEWCSTILSLHTRLGFTDMWFCIWFYYFYLTSAVRRIVFRGDFIFLMPSCLFMIIKDIDGYLTPSANLQSDLFIFFMKNYGWTICFIRD